MKLRSRIAAVGLAVATVIAMSGAASAQSGENVFAKRTIEVDGNGETRTSPDTADLDLAIDIQAKTAEEAAARNAALYSETAPGECMISRGLSPFDLAPPQARLLLRDRLVVTARKWQVTDLPHLPPTSDLPLLL